MDAEEFRKHGKEMIDFIADHVEGIQQQPIVPNVKPGIVMCISTTPCDLELFV